VGKFFKSKSFSFFLPKICSFFTYQKVFEICIVTSTFKAKDIIVVRTQLPRIIISTRKLYRIPSTKIPTQQSAQRWKLIDFISSSRIANCLFSQASSCFIGDIWFGAIHF
jgi:hypothetical protein